jgi:hypothetical protein
MKYLSLLFIVTLFGCGTTVGPQGDPGPQGLPGTVVTPPALTEVQTLIAQENEYRLTVGQELLVSGLTCSLYTVPTSTTTIVGATLTGIGSFGYTGVFDQSNSNVSTGLNILPLGLQPTYQTWIILKCYGYLVVSDDNWHSFSLSSDDGSNLYVDGWIINNDGLHAIKTVNGSQFLKYGFHSFELDFLQGTGQQALILEEDGSIMQNSGFYH